MYSFKTYLLGNLVKKQRQSQSNHPDPSTGDPGTASQLSAQVEAECGLQLPAHAASRGGVLVLQSGRGVQREEGGEDGIQGDIGDDAGVSSHGEELLDCGSRRKTQRATRQDHGCGSSGCLLVIRVSDPWSVYLPPGKIVTQHEAILEL